MEKKYTVEEFVKYVNENKNVTMKSFVERFYVPVIEKIDVCERIIKSTYFEKGSNYVKVNSPFVKILFDLNVIDLYTCVAIDFSKNVGEQFDVLNQTGLMDKLIKAVPSHEIAEFVEIMDMVKSDTIANNYETHAFVSNQITRIVDLCNTLAKPVLDKIADRIEKIDDKEINKFSKKIISILEKK